MSNCVVGLRRLRASSRDGSGVVNRPRSPLNMLLSRHTRRREFITAVGGAVAGPSVARAQPVGSPIVGFLDPRTPEIVAARLRGFRQGLKEVGFVEGENVAIAYAWGEDQIERLPSLAVNLVRRPVTAIVASGPPSSFAAKAATTTIPIVFLV